MIQTLQRQIFASSGMKNFDFDKRGLKTFGWNQNANVTIFKILNFT